MAEIAKSESDDGSTAPRTGGPGDGQADPWTEEEDRRTTRNLANPSRAAAEESSEPES